MSIQAYWSYGVKSTEFGSYPLLLRTQFSNNNRNDQSNLSFLSPSGCSNRGSKEAEKITAACGGRHQCQPFRSTRRTTSNQRRLLGKNDKSKAEHVCPFLLSLRAKWALKYKPTMIKERAGLVAPPLSSSLSSNRDEMVTGPTSLAPFEWSLARRFPAFRLFLKQRKR
ncbi:hypothetical protein M513_14081 [Trichuris suis]|uniref:Uncharacterized protein n=1 Tax=Trichuris suis TaxID=68888 RepID=A0A085LJ96_9BILA|nr:hypothetical protein M513_14081 [Trichuris suis]